MAARKAPAAKGGKSRVSRNPAAGKARTDGGASKTSLKGDIAKGAAITPVSGKQSRPKMKSPAITKAGKITARVPRVK
jgi:hypothetical protein